MGKYGLPIDLRDHPKLPDESSPAATAQHRSISLSCRAGFQRRLAGRLTAKKEAGRERLTLGRESSVAKIVRIGEKRFHDARAGIFWVAVPFTGVEHVRGITYETHSF